MVDIIHYAAFVTLWSWFGKRDHKKQRGKKSRGKNSSGKGASLWPENRALSWSARNFFSDPILVSMIVVLLVFLALFILYPF